MKTIYLSGSPNQTQLARETCIDKRTGWGRAIEKIAWVSVSPSCFRGTAMSGGIFQFNVTNAIPLVK